jgi:hypothetical protein
MKILLIVFILIVLSILLSIKKENFVNSFDDILDKKCTELNQNLNNYIGPWDGENGRCGTYTCPTETCSYIVKDNNIRNIDAYTYKQETKEKILSILDNNERECKSRNGEPVTNSDADSDVDSDANSTYNCVDDITNSIRNSPTHNEIDFCYEPIVQGDTLRWSKQTYVNVMNADGNYNWKNIDSGVINDMTPESCIKEPLDCSQCNYYCCEYYTGKDKEKKCTKQTATNADTYIHHNLKQQITPSGTSYYCEPGNTCAIIDCNYTNSNFYKDCWVYKDDFDDSSKREWINKRFERQTLIYDNKEICDFFHKDENDIMIRHKDVESMCKDDPPDINADECGIKPTIKCTYLDGKNSAFDVDYKSVLNNRGDACIYQTLTNENIVQKNYPQHYLQTQVVLETTADKVDICPELTPRDCIPKGNEELFLDKDVSTMNKTSYQCITCPPGTYRNNNLFATNVNEACSNEAICPSVDDCYKSLSDDEINSENCNSCWSNVDDSGNILKKVFQEITPDRDQCKVVKDICYYTKDLDNNNVQFTVNQCQTRIFYAGNEYCDNCPPGQAIKVEDDYLVCGDLVDCTNEHEFMCLNQDNTTFSKYTYNNKSDDFSECVYWKINEDTKENKKHDCLTQKTCMKECKVECPTLEKDGVSIPSFRDGSNCRPIKNI